MKIGTILIKELDRTHLTRELRKKVLFLPNKAAWSFLLLNTSFLLILKTSLNLKKPANDKTHKVISRNSTGLSKLELLI